MQAFIWMYWHHEDSEDSLFDFKREAADVFIIAIWRVSR